MKEKITELTVSNMNNEDWDFLFHSYPDLPRDFEGEEIALNLFLGACLMDADMRWKEEVRPGCTRRAKAYLKIREKCGLPIIEDQEKVLTGE